LLVSGEEQEARFPFASLVLGYDSTDGTTFSFLFQNSTDKACLGGVTLSPTASEHRAKGSLIVNFSNIGWWQDVVAIEGS
jgi:hypothetical protein